MSQKVVSGTLSAAIATNGTLNVTYPTGFSRGDFLLGHNHVLMCNQTKYRSPKDFTVSMGSTQAEITYTGSTTLPAGASFFFGLDMMGPNFLNVDTSWRTSRSQEFRREELIYVNLGSPDTTSIAALVNGYSAAQLTISSVTFTYATQSGTAPLNGKLSTGVLDVPRNVVLTCTHGSSVPGVLAVVTGKSIDGQTIYENLSGSGGTTLTVTGNKAFAQVTAVTFTGYSTDAGNTVFNLGTGSKLGLPFYVPDKSAIRAEFVNGNLMPSDQNLYRLPFYPTLVDFNAGSAQWLAVPTAGTVKKLVVVTTAGTILSGGLITVFVQDANTAGGGNSVAGMLVTVVNGATGGTLYTSTPSSYDDSSAQITAGQLLRITVDANFSVAGAASAGINGYVEISPTQTLRGTFAVNSVTTKPSAITNDARGTYTPPSENTMNGYRQFGLLIAAGDFQSRGTVEFAQ